MAEHEAHSPLRERRLTYLPRVLLFTPALYWYTPLPSSIGAISHRMIWKGLLQVQDKMLSDSELCSPERLFWSEPFSDIRAESEPFRLNNPNLVQNGNVHNIFPVSLIEDSIRRSPRINPNTTWTAPEQDIYRRYTALQTSCEILSSSERLENGAEWTKGNSDISWLNYSQRPLNSLLEGIRDAHLKRMNGIKQPSISFAAPCEDTRSLPASSTRTKLLLALQNETTEAEQEAESLEHGALMIPDVKVTSKHKLDPCTAAGFVDEVISRNLRSTTRRRRPVPTKSRKADQEHVKKLHTEKDRPDLQCSVMSQSLTVGIPKLSPASTQVSRVVSQPGELLQPVFARRESLHVPRPTQGSISFLPFSTHAPAPPNSSQRGDGSSAGPIKTDQNTSQDTDRGRDTEQRSISPPTGQSSGTSRSKESSESPRSKNKKDSAAEPPGSIRPPPRRSQSEQKHVSFASPLIITTYEYPASWPPDSASQSLSAPPDQEESHTEGSIATIPGSLTSQSPVLALLRSTPPIGILRNTHQARGRIHCNQRGDVPSVQLRPTRLDGSDVSILALDRPDNRSAGQQEPPSSGSGGSIDVDRTGEDTEEETPLEIRFTLNGLSEGLDTNVEAEYLESRIFTEDEGVP
ncbi:MAG: hypothetical protein M1820_001398 [Bogoriella megaspora]|nr:MAG: hypothetical protein M1820_001398 [Bogoriella megaspora]